MPKLRDDIVYEIKKISNRDLERLLDVMAIVDIDKIRMQLKNLQEKHHYLQQKGQMDDDADLVDIAYDIEHELFRYIEVFNEVRDVVNKIASFMFDERGLLKDE